MRTARQIRSRTLLVTATALAIVAFGSATAGGAGTQVWSGTTAAGVNVRFQTNAGRSKIFAGLFMAIPNVLCLYQGQGAATGAFGMTTSKAITVKGGRFSTTQPGQPDQYGQVTLKITGHFSGPAAIAKVTWSLKGSEQFTCTPTSGSFSWKAFRHAR